MSVRGDAYHMPVMAQEVVSALVTSEDGLYVDGTIGGGGHAERILALLRGGRLIGFDRDIDAIRAASDRLHAYGSIVEVVHAPFGEMSQQLRNLGIASVDGILLDLGVSSHHLDDPERGFSFQHDGPLDMRMDRNSGRSGADIVNTYELKDLISVLANYGEERDAPRIAQAIVRARPVPTTQALADIIRQTVRTQHATKTLARVFQAIRIEINDELHQLQIALHAVPELLRSGGRIVVLTYHSLEDRIVKDFFRDRSRTTDPSVSRFLPEKKLAPVLRQIGSKAARPTEQETVENPRARSAKMRVAEKI